MRKLTICCPKSVSLSLLTTFHHFAFRMRVSFPGHYNLPMGICRFRDSLFSAMIERMTVALLQRVRTSTGLRSYFALQWEVRPSCCRLPPSFVVHDKNLNLLHLFHVQDPCQQRCCQYIMRKRSVAG